MTVYQKRIEYIILYSYGIHSYTTITSYCNPNDNDTVMRGWITQCILLGLKSVETGLNPRCAPHVSHSSKKTSLPMG